MSIRIGDGKGKNGDCSVSAVQRLNVSAKTAPRHFYASRDFGLAFNAVYDNETVAAGEYSMYLKNDSSTRNMFIGVIEFHAVNAIKWKLWEVTGTAAAGEVVTPANLNLASGIPAEATAMAGDTAITGLTAGKQIGSHRSEALADSEMHFEGALVLGPGKAIAIEYDTGTTGLCSHDIFFWYEDIGAA
ncbi:MAG: hypothetical protein OCD76_07315 [Reichenbachiella sp.]